MCTARNVQDSRDRYTFKYSGKRYHHGADSSSSGSIGINGVEHLREEQREEYSARLLQAEGSSLRRDLAGGGVVEWAFSIL